MGPPYTKVREGKADTSKTRSLLKTLEHVGSHAVYATISVNIKPNTTSIAKILTHS